MPPFVNSLIHSLTTFVSSSECRSSVVAGGGAVEAKMVSITSAGCSTPPFVSLSKASCSSVKVKGSTSKGCCSVDDTFGLFDSLLQKESRSASVLKTGDVAMEVSEEDESSEDDDCADEGRRMSRPASNLLRSDEN